LPLWRGQSADERAATVPVYNDVFFKTQYIIPYPDDAAYQFQYEWYAQLRLRADAITTHSCL
jgi:hypothetical protein